MSSSLAQPTMEYDWFLGEVLELLKRERNRVDPHDPGQQPYLPGLGRRGRLRLLTRRREIMRNLIDNTLPYITPGSPEWSDDLREHTDLMLRWSRQAALQAGTSLLGAIPPDRLWDAWSDVGPACEAKMNEAILRQVFVSTLDDDGGRDVWGGPE